MTPTGVVVINYNTREHLRACLASVRSERADHVVVVDNASTDGSVEMVRSEFPEVELITNGWNAGYAAAANQAIHGCPQPYVLLLNADARLCEGALATLAAYLDENERAAVVGPRLSNADGSLQPSARPFPRLVTLRPLLRHVPGIREHYLPTWSHSEARVVPYVVGAALAIRRSAFQAVGGFDPAYFLFYEEVDLCRRLAGAGWEVHFTPDAAVVHAGGASTGVAPGTAYVHRAASERRFYLRWYAGRNGGFVAAVLDAREAARLIRDVVYLILSRDPIRRLQIERRIAVHVRLLRRDGTAPTPAAAVPPAEQARAAVAE